MTIPLDTVLPEIVFNKPFTLSKVEWFIFYLCSCLSTQFLYRTDIKATFSVKDNIHDIIKNSITLTINTTRLSYDESYNIGWQNRSTNYQFPMSIILQYYFNSVYNIYKFSFLFTHHIFS